MRHCSVSALARRVSAAGRCLSLALFLLLSACGDRDTAGGEAPGPVAPAAGSVCNLPPPAGDDAPRRLALIVGAGKYANEDVNPLPGATADARRFYELLTGDNGYGFAKEDVCLLLDEHATKANVQRAFSEALVERADENDVAVFYFAGHGSQVRDVNGDEPDEWDETLMTYDARTGDVIDILDDEINGLFAGLYAKTRHIVSVLDSCNSGTAMRGAAAGIPRFHERLESQAVPAAGPARDAGDGSASFVPETFDGMVVLTAASDGTSALEIAGRGVFTDALIDVLAQAHDEPPSYATIARQIPPLVSARSYQVPYFHGDLEQSVFDAVERKSPLGFRVTEVTPELRLSGPPLPGIGAGAEMYVYDDAVTGSATLDPSRAKARIVIDEFTGVNAVAHVAGQVAGADEVRPGDLAILARVGDEALKIRLAIRAAPSPGGLSQEQGAEIEAGILANEENRLLVELVDTHSDFELSRRPDGSYVLRGPENQVRNVYASGAEIAEIADSLWRHARQRALMLLRGEGGADFTDNETLQVQLVPAARQSPCATGEWLQAKPNSEQVVPLCHSFNVQVTLSADAPEPGLLIGAVILSTDGQTFGLPADGRQELLGPGESMVFNAQAETLDGRPPLDTQDRIMVFGTREQNPVPWHLLTQPAATRGAAAFDSSLSRILDRYLTPGTRGIGVPVEDSDVSTWTMSTVVARVEANSRFLERGSRDAGSAISGEINAREYTLPHFNIAPYLPDDSDSALYKVLTKADWLANSEASDGFDYKQHDWSKPSDEENLELGIDCSRAIWYAFTRAGLPYNQRDDYLTTAMMVTDDSRMQDEFATC
ncbi:MAG TPA: caspase family protein, partial [Woeseiaceae bacterium]|nr:caspase family protein [Woeseiaceae bacterium]